MKKQLKIMTVVSAVILSLVFFACEKDIVNKSMCDNEDVLTKVKPPSGTTTRYPLKFPAEVSPAGLTLAATPGTSDLSNGSNQFSEVWAYNNSFAGPTIRAMAGSTTTITFQNNLPEESITHWHGMIVNPENDGTPPYAIPGGSSYSYSFPITQRAFLGFYHPHPHMLTGKQVYKGLSGAFIVNDAEETALNLPSGDFEVPLIIRDATLNSTGNLTYKPTSGGFFGKIPIINGTRDPYLDVQRAVYRFRIANGSNSRIFNLNLSNGQSLILIGNDGGFLPSSSNLTAITQSPGERTDVLIDFRNLTNGTKVMLRDSRSGWNLLEFRVTGNTVVAYSGPLSTTSSTVVPLSNPVTTRVFSFDAMSKINGQEYDMNRIDWTVPFNQTERWIFTSNGNAPHPVHVHGASFQVISRTGGRGQLFPWEGGWKDTVLLEDQETVEVYIRFDQYHGIYVMHCHKLEHEDMGMMANFQVL